MQVILGLLIIGVIWFVISWLFDVLSPLFGWMGDNIHFLLLSLLLIGVLGIIESRSKRKRARLSFPELWPQAYKLSKKDLTGALRLQNPDLRTIVDAAEYAIANKSADFSEIYAKHIASVYDDKRDESNLEYLLTEAVKDEDHLNAYINSVEQIKKNPKLQQQLYSEALNSENLSVSMMEKIITTYPAALNYFGFNTDAPERSNNVLRRILPNKTVDLIYKNAKHKITNIERGVVDAILKRIRGDNTACLHFFNACIYSGNEGLLKIASKMKIDLSATNTDNVFNPVSVALGWSFASVKPLVKLGFDLNSHIDSVLPNTEKGSQQKDANIEQYFHPLIRNLNNLIEIRKEDTPEEHIKQSKSMSTILFKATKTFTPTTVAAIPSMLAFCLKNELLAEAKVIAKKGFNTPVVFEAAWEAVDTPEKARILIDNGATSSQGVDVIERIISMGDIELAMKLLKREDKESHKGLVESLVTRYPECVTVDLLKNIEQIVGIDLQDANFINKLLFETRNLDAVDWILANEYLNILRRNDIKHPLQTAIEKQDEEAVALMLNHVDKFHIVNQTDKVTESTWSNSFALASARASLKNSNTNIAKMLSAKGLLFKQDTGSSMAYEPVFKANGIDDLKAIFGNELKTVLASPVSNGVEGHIDSPFPDYLPTLEKTLLSVAIHRGEFDIATKIMDLHDFSMYSLESMKSLYLTALYSPKGQEFANKHFPKISSNSKDDGLISSHTLYKGLNCNISMTHFLFAHYCGVTKPYALDSDIANPYEALTYFSLSNHLPDYDNNNRICMESVNKLIKELGLYLPNYMPRKGEYLREFMTQFAVKTIEKTPNNYNYTAIRALVFNILATKDLDNDSILAFTDQLLKHNKNEAVIKIAYFAINTCLKFKNHKAAKPFVSLLTSLKGAKAFPDRILNVTLSGTLNGEQNELLLTKIEPNKLGVKLTYQTDSTLSNWTNSSHDIQEQLRIENFQLEQQGRNNIIHIFNDSHASELVKNIKIADKKPRFHDSHEDNNGVRYLFFTREKGVRLTDWEDQRARIEDFIGYPVSIENYDQSHPLWDQFGTDNLILIKEKEESALPRILGLTGVYLKTEQTKTGSVIQYSDIEDFEGWKKAADKISDVIGKYVDIKRQANNIVELTESVSQALPYLLKLEDSSGHMPELVGIEKQENHICYHYEFLPEVDLAEWRRSAKKTSFKNLFDEPNKVYTLEDGKYEGVKTIVLSEFDRIPTKEELAPLSLDVLKDDKIFWGYGSAGKAYYTDLNELTHTMQIGASGSGKSNLMNGVILSLLHNIKKIDKLYLIDLKSGEEYGKYTEMDSDKIRFFGDDATPVQLLEELLEVEAEMLIRSELNKKNKASKSAPPIFVIIDEFGEIENMETFDDPEERKAKEKVLSLINRLARRARSANIKLIVQTQDPNNIEPVVRKNLLTAALLKTSSDLDVGKTIVNEDLDIDHKSFDLGRYILRDENGGNTVFHELQFPFVDPSMELHMEFVDAAQQIQEHHKVPQNIIDSVRSKRDARHLLNTSALGGDVIESEQTPKKPLNSSNQDFDIKTSDFDFDALLADDEEEAPSVVEKDDKEKQKAKEIDDMRGQSASLLDELLKEL